MRLRSSARSFSRAGYQVKTRTKRVPSSKLSLLSYEGLRTLRRELRSHAGVSEIESLRGVVVGLRTKRLPAYHGDTTHTLRVRYRDRAGVWEMLFGVHSDGSLCLWCD